MERTLHLLSVNVCLLGCLWLTDETRLCLGQACRRIHLIHRLHLLLGVIQIWLERGHPISLAIVGHLGGLCLEAWVHLCGWGQHLCLRAEDVSKKLGVLLIEGNWALIKCRVESHLVRLEHLF